MMEQAITHKFSKGVRRAKERYKTLSILLPVMFIAFLFLSPTTRDNSFATNAGIALLSFVVLGLIFYFTSSITLRKLSELSVSFFPDKFERASREHRETFLWKDVQSTEVLEYPNGEIATIKLILAKRKEVTLFGFEDMEGITKQIEQVLPDGVSIRRKRTKLNWDQPITITFILLLTLAIVLAIQEIGEKAYRFFNVFFFFSCGFYNLVSRPISRAQGAGWKMFETVIGIFLITCSVFLLALELFLK